MPSTKSPRRSLIVNLLLFVVGFGLLGVVIYRNRLEIQKVFQKPVDYRLFGLGLLVYLVALMLTFVRWHQLVKALGLNFAFRDALRLGFIGNVFNLVIPGAVGGDVIKAAFLCRMQPDKKPQAVASMVLDRILGLLGLFVIAGIAGAFTWKVAGPEVRILIGLVWGAIAAGASALAVAFSPSLYRPLNRLVAGRPKLKSVVGELEGIGLAYRERIGRVVAMLGLAIFVHSLFVIAFYTASVALFGNELPTLAQHYLMVPLILFSTAVPLPFGALGLTEGISEQLFGMVDHQDGAIAMMAFRILMYGSGIVSACVYFANLGQVQTLKKNATEVVGEALESMESMDQTIVDSSIHFKQDEIQP